MPDNVTDKSRILLVEDEQSLATGLIYNLSEEGYRVEWVTDGRQALEHFYSSEYDLVILDVMLPYLDGFTVAEKIRLRDARLPILILTARTGARDRIKGLETGADDYMTKPFHLEELLLRVKGMLRRKAWYQYAVSDVPVYRIGAAEVNFENLICQKHEQENRLTVREAMVLKYLIENRGRGGSRKDLLPL